MEESRPPLPTPRGRVNRRCIPEAPLPSSAQRRGGEVACRAVPRVVKGTLRRRLPGWPLESLPSVRKGNSFAVPGVGGNRKPEPHGGPGALPGGGEARSAGAGTPGFINFCPDSAVFPTGSRFIAFAQMVRKQFERRIGYCCVSKD